MSEIITVIKAYQGNGFLLVLYVLALVYLLIREKDRRTRVMLVYVPVVILILFLLPPVYRIYSGIEEAGTYYRFLWLIPISITTIYAGLKLSVRLLGKLRCAGYAVLCAAVIACGSCVYGNVNVLAADNLQHVPYQVVDICEYLLQDHDGEPLKAAFPSNIVQFIRQYTSKISMPYGRDMLIGEPYWNEVYDVMEVPETINASDLAHALIDTECDYVVLDPSHPMDGDLEDYDFEHVIMLDGFEIYRVPEK